MLHHFAPKQSAGLKQGPGPAAASVGGDSFSKRIANRHLPATCPSSAR